MIINKTNNVEYTLVLYAKFTVRYFRIMSNQNYNDNANDIDSCTCYKEADSVYFITYKIECNSNTDVTFSIPIAD